MAMETTKFELSFLDSSGCVVPPPRQCHGVARLGEKLVIVGGHTIDDSGTYERKNDIWVFDTVNATFTEITPAKAPEPMSRHRMVTIGDKIYSFGGILSDLTKLNSLFTFDLKSNEWRELEVKGTPPTPRCGSVVQARGKDIIVFGGSVGDLIFTSDVHVFNTETATWSTPEVKGEQPSSRIGSVGLILHDKLYVYGGGAYDKELQRYREIYTDIWCLDLNNWTWEKIQTPGVPPPTDVLNGFVVGNHIVIEGWGITPHCFDTITRSWRKLDVQPNIYDSDSSCSVVGDAAYFYGGYYHSYQHYMVKMDLSSLSFLLK